MLNFEHIFPYPFKSKAVFAMQEPNVKQEYRIAALVHSRLVADIVYRETLLLGWNISIEVTSYETALEDARRLFEEGYEVLLCTMIQVHNLKKKFDDFQALNGVDMHVGKGDIYGLVGPNGAGKSTLIRHLTGVYKADEGEILIDGEPVFENRNIKQRMAYIPDELFYFMQADTMEMKRFYEGIYPQFDSKLFYKMQEFFPTIDVKRTIRRLSKGMQKQVAFWLAICCKPDLLILDEPVDGLDPVMRRQIWSILMAEVAERKMTVLVSSHNLRELEDTCDHVGIMHHGKIMIERSLSDLQGNISKIQVACQNGVPKLPDDFEVLHMANTGRVYTLIVKGDPKEAEKVLLTENPTIVDVLPLTLEEIFIYELGGVDYEVKDILL